MLQEGKILRNSTSASPASYYLPISTSVETREHSKNTAFSTLQNNQILRTSSATWRLHSMPRGCLWGCSLPSHADWKAQLKPRQKGSSANVPFPPCSLHTLFPHVCLTVSGEHRGFTQPLLSSYYCFCITHKETEPQSRDHTAPQADLNLSRHNAKALLLLLQRGCCDTPQTPSPHP